MNPRNLKPEEVLELLEMPPETFRLIRDKKCLEIFKEKVRKQRKVLAKKYHPDKFPTQDIMQTINAICDLLLKTQIIKRPQPVIFRYTVYSSGPSSTTASTT